MKPKKESMQSSKKSTHKKKKSKKKDKKKYKAEKKQNSSSSDSSSDSDQEMWVEKEVPKLSTSADKQNVTKEHEPLKRDDWMNMNSVFPCIFNPSHEEKKAANKSEKDAQTSILADPGQSARELNPYWKNGGDGLPQVEPETLNREQKVDVNWLKKSLRRAQEQADSEGKTLEEVAAERWGSLETIQSMIENAKRTSMAQRSGRSYNRRDICNSNRSLDSTSQSKNESYRNSRHHSNRDRESKWINRSRSRSRSRDRFERHKKWNTSPPYERKQKQTYRKPMDDDCSTYTSHKVHSSHTKNWKKQRKEDKTVGDELKSNTPEKECSTKESKKDLKSDTDRNEIKALTEAEMNKLGAKIVKAEIMGNTELATELKLQLEKARELTVKSTAVSHEKEIENIILTRTDAKGVTRPLEPRTQYNEPSGSSKKKKNVQTHVSGERVRHYFDDDKYSLKQLFEREKGRSVNEDDATFVKLSSKRMDMQDLFEEQITRTQTDAKQDEKDRSLAIKEHKRFTKSLDSCRWCIDSKFMLKHMIVTMDSDICLSLPSCSSLTDGHCILTPTQHVACQLQLDEDIWQKLKIFKRTLCKMFLDQNQYPVFFEIYKSRHKFPHMQLECVPLPKEIGQSAPMYFKKALLECETEWSVNKKVIDLKNKDVRHAVPNGLSYFMVSFDTDGGYAHVIEDEEMFPRNFAEEIIGGMLDLDHDLWRKPRKENFDQQLEKVLKFTKMSKKYDFGIKVESD